MASATACQAPPTGCAPGAYVNGQHEASEVPPQHLALRKVNKGHGSLSGALSGAFCSLAIKAR